MKISIITPILNLTPRLQQFTKSYFESLDAFHPSDYESIVIDNGSDQPIEPWVGQADIFVKNKVNNGYGGAMNQGLKLATGDYIIFSNNDIILPKGWVQAFLDAFKSREHVGLVSVCSNPSGIVGCFWGIPRAIYEKVGLFDENMGLGPCQDTDYFYRMAKMGYIWATACKPLVHHPQSTFMQKAFRDKFANHPLMSVNGREIFAKKHGFPAKKWRTRGYAEFLRVRKIKR